MVVAVVVVVRGPQLRSTKHFPKEHAKKSRKTSVSSCSSILEQWVTGESRGVLWKVQMGKGQALMLD